MGRTFDCQACFNTQLRVVHPGIYLVREDHPVFSMNLVSSSSEISSSAISFSSSSSTFRNSENKQKKSGKSMKDQRIEKYDSCKIEMVKRKNVKSGYKIPAEKGNLQL